MFQFPIQETVEVLDISKNDFGIVRLCEGVTKRWLIRHRG
jgi:hypothetical protein